LVVEYGPEAVETATMERVKDQGVAYLLER
jgi:hypothetical protein